MDRPNGDVMSKLRVQSFAISIDGYGAGPNQDLQNPLGVRGPELMERSEEHTSELQSHSDLVCRLLLEKKKIDTVQHARAHVVRRHEALQRQLACCGHS